jgi:glycosyltransferase involved in cell wall biosynthesis
VKPGEASIGTNFKRFETLVEIAEAFHRASDHRSAVACAQVAAACAWRNHAGLFASPRLERLLTEIACKTVSAQAPGFGPGRPFDSVPGSALDFTRGRRTPPERVLHVLTKARPMGGDSRFPCRWMHVDGRRQHSVAVTTQEGDPVPDVFLEATSGTGGYVHCLDADTADPLVRAGRLRSLAQDADLVALHIYPDDVIPSLAFGDGAIVAPILFVNHSDHTFWLGVNASDMVVQLRDSSVPLSVNRRGVHRNRLATLPIPLPPVERTRSRSDARAQLGITADAIVLLSVGTGFKYAPIDGPGFLETLLPLVRKHEHAVVLVVGPQPSGEWARAAEATGGRVRALGRQLDTAVLYEAADIYLDSFPFTSPTAMLEAGSYGLPLVAYCPHRGDAEVLSPGAPGLDVSICRNRDVEAYTYTVSRLIEDPSYRRELGDAACQEIDRHHRGTAWMARLSDLYASAVARSTREPVAETPDKCLPDAVDVLVSRLYGIDEEAVGGLIDRHVRNLPWLRRIAVLWRMLGVSRSFSFDLFLPAWLASRASWRPPFWRALRQAIARRGAAARRVTPCVSA